VRDCLLIMIVVLVSSAEPAWAAEVAASPEATGAAEIAGATMVADAAAAPEAAASRPHIHGIDHLRSRRGRGHRRSRQPAL
jgi:hypothetical protein